MVDSMLASRCGAKVERAVVRDVASTLGRVRGRNADSSRQTLASARHQHAVYVRTLKEAGIEITTLPGDDVYPEGAFIEDLAVPVGLRHVIVCRSGRLAREGEEATLRETLFRWRAVHDLPPEARLDGGDVIIAGERLFVALTEFTNEEGVDFVQRVAALERLEVLRIALNGDFRLRQIVSPLGEETLLHLAGSASREVFPGCELVAAPEAAGANVLAVNGVVLVPAEAPRTVALLERRGYRVIPVPLSNFLELGAGPTRLSVRV